MKALGPISPEGQEREPAPLTPGNQLQAEFPDQPEGPKPATLNDFPDQPLKLQQQYGYVSGVDPDHAAKVAKYAEQSGVEPAFIDKNMSEVERSAKTPPSSFFAELERERPGTAKFLEVPAMLAASHDDLDNLAWYEKAFSGVKDAWNSVPVAVRSAGAALESGTLQEELGFLQNQRMEGNEQVSTDYFRPAQGVTSYLVGDQLTDEQKKMTPAQARVDQIQKRMKELEQHRPESGWLKKSAFGALEFLPQIPGQYSYGLKYALPAAGAAGLAGLETGPADIAITDAAFAIGMKAGEGEYNYRLMSGLAYDQLSQITDANGQHMSPDVVRNSSMAIGATAAALGIVQFGAAREALGKFLKEAPRSIFDNPATLSAAFTSFVKETGKTALHGGGAIAGITGVNVAGREIAKRSSGLDFTDGPNKYSTAGEMLGEVGHSFAEGVGSFAMIGAAGNLAQVPRDISNLRKAAEVRDVMLALSDKAQQSKVLERLPEKFQEHIKELTKDGPLETAYIPTEAFREYFQSKGISPELAAKDLGIESKLADAERSGHVEVPLSTLTAKLGKTEHLSGLANDIKFDPAEHTFNESHQIYEQRAHELDKLHTEAERRRAVEELGPILEDKRLNGTDWHKDPNKLKEILVTRERAEELESHLTDLALENKGLIEQQGGIEVAPVELINQMKEASAAVEAIRAMKESLESVPEEKPSADQLELQRQEESQARVAALETQKFLGTGRYSAKQARVHGVLMSERYRARAAARGLNEAAFDVYSNADVVFKKQPEATADAQASQRSYNQSVSLRDGRETLKRYGLDPEKKYTTRQVAQALQERQRKKFGSVEANDFSPEAAKKISKWMHEEVLFEMRDGNEKRSGVGWYSEKFQRALDTMGKHFPELLSDEAFAASDSPGNKKLGNRANARDFMTALIAITSDGQKVSANFDLAMKAFEAFRTTGELPLDVNWGGERNKSFLTNFEALNHLMKEMGPQKMRDFLLSEARVGDLKKMAKEQGRDFTVAYKVDTKMPMAALVFGPKLGAFYANLMGSSGYLTMDRWWSRTFNRYRGTLIPEVTKSGLARFKELLGEPHLSDEEAIARTKAFRDSYKDKGYKGGTEIEKAANTIYKTAFEGIEDTPFNASDRDFMINTVQMAQKSLKKAGIDLSVADIQAILWYYEKRLYGELGARQSADISYEETARKLVEQREAGDRGDQPDRSVAPDAGSDVVEGPDGTSFDVAHDAGAAEESFNAADDRGRGSERGADRERAVQGEDRQAQHAPLVNLEKNSRGPNLDIRNLSLEYMRDAGLPVRQQHHYVKATPERGSRIAEAYAEMKHDPENPEVKAAYEALAEETMSQFQAVKKLGFTFSRIEPGMDPYPKGPKQAIDDMHDNKHLWFFPTEDGFGTLTEIKDNPLLKGTGEFIDGKELLVNDVFRIVHDVFGHGKEGVGFGPSGEENAWQSHVRMYSDLAARAMTSETRGQNSWVNFGPHGENNRSNPRDTVYADQKVGLLPEWVLKEDLAADRPMESDRSYDQGAAKGEVLRGRIRFGGLRAMIELFQHKDLSTAAHEGFHLFLDEMIDDATMESAPEQLRKDLDTLLEWVGSDLRVKDGAEAIRTGISVEQHEQIARGGEHFLMEGNAPIPRLQNIFNTFRKWMLKIYQQLDRLGVPMNDDVRQVYSRMLVSDAEIKLAQSEIGYRQDHLMEVSGKNHSRVEALREEARTTAERTLFKEQMRKVKLQRESFLIQERERLRMESEAAVNEFPVFKAQAELEASRGSKKPHDFAARMLEGRLKEDKAAAFHEAAERHDFASGEDLARAIVDAHNTDLFKKEVEARVEHGMSQHDKLMEPAELKEAALASVHNEKMVELLALEHQIINGLIEREGRVKALRDWKKAETGEQKAFTDQQRADEKRAQDREAERYMNEAKIFAKAARDKAQQILADQPIKDAANYRKYVTDERNAAVRVSKALAKKDYETAALHKQHQILSHALAAEALKNKKESDRALKFLSQLDKKTAVDAMPFGFARQVNQLLAKFQFTEARAEDTATLQQIAQGMMEKGEEAAEITNRTGLKLDANGTWVPETLPDFVTRVNDNYTALTIPARMFSLAAKGPKELTLGELRDLRDAAKAIAHVGKNYDRFLTDWIKIGVKEAAAEFRKSVEELVGTPYAESMLAGSKHASKMGEKLQALLNMPDTIVPDLINMATLTQFLDGGKETGPAKEYIYRPLKAAEDRKLARYTKAVAEINALFEAHYTPKQLGEYKNQRRAYEEIRGRFFTKEEVLALALNWGNEGNRDRIRKGFGLTDQQVMSIIDKTLEKRDWDFAQGVWDHLDTYWADVAALEMKIHGAEPGRVQAAEVVTKHGNYRGGYYPISYDFAKNADAYKNAEQKNALYKQFSAAGAHTDKGHTEARVTTVTRPVRLSLDVLFNHLENVIHDVEFRPAVIDVNRFLSTRDVKESIVNAVGLPGQKAVGDWLKAVASDQGEHLSMADKAFRWFRFNATMATLGYRLAVVPMDIVGNTMNSVWEIGPKRVATAIKEYAMNPSETKELVHSKSERMKSRATLFDRDVMEISKKWDGQQSAFKTYAFLFQHFADEAVSVPLWAEIYRHALATHGDERKAIDIADETVSRTVGSGSKLDQVGAQRGPESKKILSMYYSFMSMMFNRVWLDGKMAGLAYDKGTMGQALAIMAKATFFAWGVQSLNENFWKEAFRNKKNDNDEEQKKRILARTLQQPFAYVWIARDIAPLVVETALGSHSANFRVSPVEQAVENIFKPIGMTAQIAFGNKQADQKYGEKVAQGASYLIGYPNQLNSLTFNFLDWTQDKGEATWKDFLGRKTKN